jgi:D-3-phosphoglycerate dehydrogenase
MALPIQKKVVRTATWTSPIFDEILAKTPDADLSVMPINGPERASLALLEQAHVYHVFAARDELPPRWHVTADLLRHCPNLLCVSSSGAGYDTIDVEACTRAGIAVVNQAGGNATSVAEQTLGLMLSVSRRLGEQDRRMRQERGFSREDVMGHEISGKVLGLIGIGHIGTQVARLARAFGMTVLATDPYLSDDEITRRGAVPVKLDHLLARSDIVSLHCPRTKETTRLIDAGSFEKMKPGALFITTARGGIHDEDALFDALRSGHIGGAGIDVWSVEPPPLDHPLLTLANVVTTFHTAGVSHEGRRNIAKIAAEQIREALKGHRPPRLVNPEVWPVYVQRFESLLGIPVNAKE